MRRTHLGLILVVAPWAVVASSCSKKPVSLESRACETQDDCLSGYLCNPANHICESAATACIDFDGDGYGEGDGCLGPDCDEQVASCNTDCTSNVDIDLVRDCEDTCVDQDHDGYGRAQWDRSGCAHPEADCDDNRAATCNLDCSDSDSDGLRDCDQDTCIDVDKDGYGVGTSCLGDDCDDSVAACNVTCGDLDNDQIRDCDADSCVDADGDGYGDPAYRMTICTGSTTVGDCDDSIANCTTDCDDTDGDSIADCNPADTCVDADGDGVGVSGAGRSVSGFGTSTCAPQIAGVNVFDSDDTNPQQCADTEGSTGDSCDDCDNEARGAGLGYWSWFGDGLNDGAKDIDNDGWCDGGSVSGGTPDCADDLSTCTTDCDTNTDGTSELLAYLTPDCIETYCGSNPSDPSSVCRVIATESELGTYLTCAAADCPQTLAGQEHLLLRPSTVGGDFTIGTQRTFGTGADGVTVRLVEGARVIVTANLSPVFSLPGTTANNVIDGLTVDRSATNINYDAFLDSGNGNTFQHLVINNCRNYAVDFQSSTGGALLDSVITKTQSNGTATVLVSNDAVGTVVARNKITGNAITGVRVFSLSDTLATTTRGTWIIGNLIANNTGEGIFIDNDHAGTLDTHVVGNVVVGNSAAAVRVQEAFGLYIDQNTLAGSADGIRFDATNSGTTNAGEGICIRNNNITDNTDALQFDNAVTFNTIVGDGCIDALYDSATTQYRKYGNNRFGNTTNGCNGAQCTSVPGDFWEFADAPNYCDTADLTAGTSYCLGDGSSAVCSISGGNTLLGVGCDLGYDLATYLTGTSAPAECIASVDVGARQSGVGTCP